MHGLPGWYCPNPLLSAQPTSHAQGVIDVRPGLIAPRKEVGVEPELHRLRYANAASRATHAAPPVRGFLFIR